MGSSQDRILEELKKNNKGMTPFEIAERIGYTSKTKLGSLLQRLKRWGDVDYKIINKKKLWFFVGGDVSG